MTNPFLKSDVKLPPIKSTLEQRFDDFHSANPHVYHKLVRMTRDLMDRGHKKIGIAMLFEVLRWQHMMDTDDPYSEFKLNNDYRAYYARLIMDIHPEFQGIFNVRELKAV
jgi:hypothetical protein